MKPSERVIRRAYERERATPILTSEIPGYGSATTTGDWRRRSDVEREAAKACGVPVSRVREVLSTEKEGADAGK